MTEYKVQVKSFGDILKLRKLCAQNHVSGYIRQNAFKASLKYGIPSLVMALPLEEAVLCIEQDTILDANRMEALFPGLQS